MDSNFQVKISANISDLQRSIKDAQATLAQLKQTTDGVSGSMRNMEQNTNRGRMVAFAFGQVIRDAGFFSQSFSLGILAISNNIPILIDQLALSIKVLQPFAGTLSLIGSLLTAGLTIWAYSSQSVKNYADEVNKARAGAMSTAAEMKSLLSIAKDESLSLAQRQDAINRLNDGYEGYNKELTIANVNSAKNIKRSEDMASVMMLEAEAAVVAAQAQAIYAKSLKIKDMPAAELGGFLETLDYLTVGKFDIGKPFENILKMSGSLSLNIFNIANGVKDIYNNFSGARQEIADINDQARKNQLSELDNQAKAFEDRLRKINLEITSKLLKKDGGKIKESVFSELSTELDKINANLLLSFSEKSKAKANAYQRAIESLIEDGLDPANEKIAQLQMLTLKFNYDAEGLKRFEEGLKRAANTAKTLQSEIDKEIGKDGLNIPEADMPPANDPLLDPNIKRIDKIKEIMEQRAKEVAAILNEGMVVTVGNAMMAIGEAFATGGNAAEAFGAGILSSLSGLLSQLADKLIAAGLAGLTFSKAMKSLFNPDNWALALAAGVALKVAAGAAGGFARGLSGGGGSGGASSTPLGSSFGGISRFSPNTSMTNSVGMTANSQPVIETRVSGNDLVILMNRSSNARNNYY